MDLSAWLRDLGLSRYERTFRDNAVDGDVLADLTDDHLREMGLPLGHRLKLLKALEALRPHPPHAGSASSAASEGERRQVAVLFVDLVGFTTMSSELDAEEVHALLGRFFERVDGIVEDHGGRIDKHIGDCVMAVFGAPVAHGNDAERAVRTALAARSAMEGLSLECGRAVDVHIGIAAGQVVASGTGSASHSEYTITGESVNLASRLTHAAGPGEILVSDEIWHRLAGTIHGENVGDLTVKGLRRPVSAWRLGGLRSVQAGTPRGIFVGRGAELDAFRAALAESRDTGHGGTVLVRGEAGIGKTRFVEQCARAAADAGFACHAGLVLDFGGGAGRDAISALVGGLIGLGPSMDAAQAAEAIATALAGDRAAEHDSPFLYDLLDLPQPAAERAVYEAMDAAARELGKRRALCRLVATSSRKRPRLLIVEDVHWADAPTLAHLASLAEAVTHGPALFVMTSRPERDPLDRAWRSHAPASPLATIDLGPLGQEEALELAESLSGVDEPFAQRCVERAAGNPLFLEQLLRHAQDSADAVPGSVQSLVQALLDRLMPEDRQALQAVAVLGQRFDAEMLAHMTRRADCTPVHLIAERLVRPQGDGFLFAHALIRDAIYDTLLRNRRRELHRRAADWFATRDSLLHAEHLERAEDPDAPQAYLAAARSQAGAYRWEQALRLAERGLALATRRDDRFELAALSGDLLHDIGAMAQAGQAYGDALAAAATEAERCRAYLGLAAVKRTTDDLDRATADLERAAADASAGGLIEEQARVHFLRGNILFPSGDIEGVLREHQSSVELARACGSAELEVAALGGLGDAEYMRGRLVSAHRYFRECVELAARRGFGRIEVANRPMAAFARWYAQDTQSALGDALVAIDAAARVGHRRAEMVAQHAAYMFRHALADFDAAFMAADRSLVLARQLSALRFEAEGLAFRAELHRRAGRDAAALADLAEALDIARRTGMTFVGPIILVTLAVATRDSRVRDEALAEGEALLAAGSACHNHFLFRRDAVDLFLDIGDWSAAERQLAALEEYSAAEPMPWTDFVVARGRALIAHGRGDAGGALTAELAMLARQGERLGLRLATQRIEAALAARERLSGSRRRASAAPPIAPAPGSRPARPKRPSRS